MHTGDWCIYFTLMDSESRIFHGINTEDFVILACIVLTGSQSVTDTQTDERFCHR